MGSFFFFFLGNETELRSTMRKNYVQLQMSPLPLDYNPGMSMLFGC